MTRIVLDVNRSLEHKIFVIRDPLRLVIDLPKAELSQKAREQAWNPARLKDTSIQEIRFSSTRSDDLRVVMDLAEPVKPRGILLPPVAQYGNRLVVDLFPKQVTSSRKSTEFDCRDTKTIDECGTTSSSEV